MRKKLILVGVVGLWVVAGIWLSTACGSGGAEQGSTLVPQAVFLESASPSSGPLGTEVILHGAGFTSENNDVGFSHPAIDFQGRNTAYLNYLSSRDGITLRLDLPDNDDVLLAACAYSQLGPNERCPDIGLLLPFGEVQVSVINDNGESNRIAFFVSEPGTAQPTP